MKTITKKEWATKKRHGYASIINKQRYILTMNDNGATCLMPVLIEELDRPETGKVYQLIGMTGTKSISNGNTWKESEVQE